MSSKTEVKDVVSLLAQLNSGKRIPPPKPKMPKVTTAQTVCVAQPEPSLIEPWEPDFFPGYRLLRPSGEPIDIDRIWAAYVAGEVIIFVGPTGTGKSSLAFYLLDRANESTREKNRQIYARNTLKLQTNPNLNVNDLEGYIPLPYQVAFQACKLGTRTEDLVGTVDLIYDAQGNKKPVVRFGSMTDAWTTGKTFIGEETDALDPGVAIELHHFLDLRTKETMIYINGPQKIVKSPRFRAILTQNSTGDGSNRLEYAGTNVQNGALLNRFTYVVRVTYLPVDTEVKMLVKKTHIHEPIARRMVLGATKVRNAYEREGLTTSISTRDLLTWSREILREEERVNVKHTDTAYWRTVVVPSAYMSILSCIRGDETSRSAILGFLDVM